MKKHFYFLISLFLLVILVSCTSSVVLSSQEEPPLILNPINDLSTLDSDNDLYIMRLLTDEDTQSLLKELKTYYDALDIGDISNYYTVYNYLLEICNNNKYSGVKEKLENMILSSSNLLKEYTLQKEITLQVEVLGEAKEAIITSLNSLVEAGHSIEEPQSLVFDYRDLIYLRLIAKSIIGIYDGENAVDSWYETLGPIDSNDPWPYLLKEEAYEAIQNYQEYLDATYPYQYPWKYEDAWLKLDELVEELAGITDPQDLLKTDDLFKEKNLILYGLDFAIEELDFLTEVFNEIYTFEVERTDENGWTVDNKTSFYEYVFLLLSTDLEDISIKNYLNQEIEDLEVSEEVEEVKFGEVDLLKSPKKGELLGELDGLLPNKNLVMSTKWATETKQFLGRTVTEINASITLDFDELSNVPLDVMVNNLEAEKDIIEVLIDEKIWEILSEGEIRSDKALEILEKLLDKLTFGDSDEHSITIILDDSITIIVDLDVKKYIF